MSFHVFTIPHSKYRQYSKVVTCNRVFKIHPMRYYTKRSGIFNGVKKNLFTSFLYNYDYKYGWDFDANASLFLVF